MMPANYIPFGDRLRQIRNEMGLTQEELAKKLGTTKQVLSCYETNQRAPKIALINAYAEKLGVSLDYMLGDSSEEAVFIELCTQPRDKPFYKIFIDITTKMGLDIPDIVRITGLTDKQVRTIITRQLKDAPLLIALRLSDTLDVPLEVWTGGALYAPSDISIEAREVAMAYDRAGFKDRNTARVALDLPPTASQSVSSPDGS